MKVEIWSDIVCPFCYIGKRNFETALEALPFRDEIEVEWKSFQLDPTTPKTPTDKSYVEILAEKYGWTAEKAQQNIDSMAEMAKASGLNYQMDKLKRLNTFDSHRIIQLAKTKGLGNEIEEAFFKAYFTEGKDLSQEAVQIEILEKIGLTKDDLKNALQNKVYEDAVRFDIIEAQQIGVRGVPFFVLNRKYAVSGAQPPAGFQQALETAYSEWKSEK